MFRKFIITNDVSQIEQRKEWNGSLTDEAAKSNKKKGPRQDKSRISGEFPRLFKF